jgi:copper chaperone CopZ
MKTTLIVNGMTCDHCRRSVTDALLKLEGVSAVDVDLQTKEVAVEHSGVDESQMREAIDAVGFEVG